MGMKIERLLAALKHRYPTEEEIEFLLNAGVDPTALDARDLGEEESDLEFYRRHFEVRR